MEDGKDDSFGGHRDGPRAARPGIRRQQQCSRHPDRQRQHGDVATGGKLKTAKVTQDGSGNATATITQKGGSNAAQIQQVPASGGSSINSALKFKKSIFPEDDLGCSGNLRDSSFLAELRHSRKASIDPLPPVDVPGSGRSPNFCGETGE